MKTRFILIPFLLFGCFTKVSTQSLAPAGGGAYPFDGVEHCISPEERTLIINELNIHVERLTAEGKLPLQSRVRSSTGTFAWPLRAAEGLDWFSYYGISNFVDQNSATGLLDYNCTSRTYDGHKGLDITTWPFPWYLQENDLVEIVAGRSGVIIFKSDGNDDDHCSCAGSWNAIYIQHDDGSVAWYGHMKKNSITEKEIGAMVTQGELLGIVGSSGCSTTPHLHLEIYKAQPYNRTNLIDPFAGDCNSLNTDSWWVEQRAFHEPTLNAILTHSAPPVLDCPGTEEAFNAKTQFNAGDSFSTGFYYSDQQQMDESQYVIRQPDNSIWADWKHNAPSGYNVSYWFWNWTLPGNAIEGIWTVEATYKGKTLSNTFQVGEVTATHAPDQVGALKLFPNPTTGLIQFERRNIGPLTVTLFNTGGQMLRVQKIKDNRLNLEDLPKGVYLLKIKEGNLLSVQKVIKL